MEISKSIAKLLNIIMLLALLLMAVGFIFAALKINASGETAHMSVDLIKKGLSSPDGGLFFSLATALILLGPILMACFTVFAYIKKGQLKMAALAAALFAVLAVTVIIKV